MGETERIVRARRALLRGACSYSSHVKFFRRSNTTVVWEQQASIVIQPTACPSFSLLLSVYFFSSCVDIIPSSTYWVLCQSFLAVFHCLGSMTKAVNSVLMFFWGLLMCDVYSPVLYNTHQPSSCCAACASVGGWKPSVWNHSLLDSALWEERGKNTTSYSTLQCALHFRFESVGGTAICHGSDFWTMGP